MKDGGTGRVGQGVNFTLLPREKGKELSSGGRKGRARTVAQKREI